MRLFLSLSFSAVVAVVLVLADRRHADELARTGVDRFGDWHRSRRLAVWLALAAMVTVAIALLLEEWPQAVSSVVSFGGGGLVLCRGSRRGERHEAEHGRG